MMDAELVDQEDCFFSWEAWNKAGLFRKILKSEVAGVGEISKTLCALSKIVLFPRIKKGGERDLLQPGKRTPAAELHELDDVLMIGGLESVELVPGPYKGERLREKLGSRI
jgi:hypothetical protein